MKTVFIVAVLLIVLLFPVALSHTLYCFIYENEDWNLWKKCIRSIDEFEYISESGMFIIPNTNIRAYIWEDGLCSIHWGDDNCLCTFDTYHSKKMAKLLMAKIK